MSSSLVQLLKAEVILNEPASGTINTDVRWEPIGREAWKLSVQPAWRDGQTQGALSMSFMIPVKGIGGFWSPMRSGGFENQNFVKWTHTFKASMQYTPPILAFTDRELGHRGFIAALAQAGSYYIDLKLSQHEQAYRLAIRYPAEGWLEASQWDDIALYIRDPLENGFKVFDALKDFVVYYEMLTGNGKDRQAVPACAYRPVFCTWYAVHGAPDSAWVEQNAAIAAELGFGNIILDDGWFYDKRQRVGTNLEGWFDYIGDWLPSREKFPDFAMHVKRVQAMGLKYILWYNPYAVGSKSRAYERNRYLIATAPASDGASYYCVQDSRIRQEVADHAVRLVDSYGINGLKVDYLYGVETDICSDKSHHHFEGTAGRAIVSGMKEIYDRIKAMDPDFNMMHVGGPVMNSFSTSLRSIDVPFDPDTNLYFLIYMRILASRLPIQSDPLFWPADSTMEEIARYMITAMFSVPCLSVDLIKLSEQEKKLIANWLAFYERNMRTLLFGDLSIHNTGPLIAWVRTADREKSITGIFRDAPVHLDDADICILMNGSGRDTILVKENAGVPVRYASCYDVESRLIDCTGPLCTGWNELRIPIGGTAVLRRK